MEDVQNELKRWGELIIRTAAGDNFEIHLGDTEFDLQARMIKLKTPGAEYLIAGDSVESLKKHYGHTINDGSH
jgi:hypothetical protein